MSNHRKIFIKNLIVDVFIGVHDFEKKNKQRVVINVEVDVDPDLRVENDLIKETVDYDSIRAGILEISQERHFNLQETFCEKILALCLSHQRVLAAKVSSEKPDIYTDCDSVGFEIFQRNK